MTQSGSSIVKINKTFEDYKSLKRYLHSPNVRYCKEYIRNIPQVTTASAVNVEEVSGQTLTAMSSNKTLEVWQLTDQVGTDGSATGVVEWMNATGTITSSTFTLDGTDTTTHVALTGATTARNIRSFSLDSIDCADEVVIGNSGGTEIYSVIKTGQHECLKSKFMGAVSRRTFIGKIDISLSLSTAVVSLVMTYKPVSGSFYVTKTINIKEGFKSFEPCIEIEPASEVSFTIIDDNAAHPTADIEITYLEGYN